MSTSARRLGRTAVPLGRVSRLRGPVAGLALILLLVLFAGCGDNKTEAADEVRSQNGHFNVSYTPDSGEIVVNEMQTWTLHVETADGEPVETADVTIDGDMPAHGHGLPTQPEITENLGGGDYRLEGLKFHMPGYWVVVVGVETQDVSDTAEFELNLE
jgi:hypothetical protein